MKNSGIVFFIFLAMSSVSGNLVMSHGDLFPRSAANDPGKGHRISVEVTKVKSDEGMIMMQLLDPNQEVITQSMAPVRDGKSYISFDNIPDGRYVIRYYHDANGNMEMDFNGMGIPKEGYGNSNNVRGFFGPPNFEDMIFEVKEDVSLVLKTVK